MQLFMIHLPAQLSDPKTFDALLSHLDPPAQDRVRRFRLPADALRSTVGRLAPIWYLRTRGLIPPASTPRFGATTPGKPVLLFPEIPLAFNTSHDGACVLFGVDQTPKGAVGVDIMQYPQDVWGVQEGISDQLTRGEQAVLALPSLGDTERRRLVTALWTLKEGYVKATGDGLGFGLERIDVQLDGEGRVGCVRVDGRDVSLDGWRWASGAYSGPADTYGWSVFWRGDEWPGQVQHVEWGVFTQPFTRSEPDVAAQRGDTSG